MAYYQTLPEWMRNNHLIRQVVVGMEFHGSHVANQAEKEAVLNMCLQFILPLPKCKKSSFRGNMIDWIEYNSTF